MSAELTAAEIIDRLGLEPLPLEGGQWAVSWRNDDVSAIHFLLQPGDFSAFHSLTATELWHHNGGAPVQMVLLHPDGSIERPVLGIDLVAGHQPMVGVGPGVWMAAATMGEWSLVATSVSPPYEDDRFTLADRAALLASHPAASSDIEALTRPSGGTVTTPPNQPDGNDPTLRRDDTALPSPAELLDLTGRVIVVTGAGGGIGSGIAERLVAAGANVVAHTRATPVEVTGRDGAPIPVVTADLVAEDGPATVIDQTMALRGRIDGLVNNAAIQPIAPLADLADEDWRLMIETDLTAAHRLTKLAASTMIERGAGGTIVHIASIEASQPAPDHEHYGVAKAALVMHARASASAYGRHGIRINSVSPGLIDRDGLAEQWPDGVTRWRAAAPLGRLGSPDDVGDACVFLCSDLSRWITGTDLLVDGGVLTRPTW